MKYRGYEHGIYKHSDLRTNLSIKNIPYEVEDNNETEARRSQRLQHKDRVDYRKMDRGI